MDQSASHSNRLWQGCSLLLVLGLVGAILLFAEWRAQAAERDARAPVVIADPVGICRLSPSGQFLFVSLPGGVRFYDLAQQQWVDLPLETIMSGPGGSFWLPDNRYFRFHTWREERAAHDSWRVPTDGYLIDVTNRVITDILSLPPSQQVALLQLATERERVISRGETSFTAPDGQYNFWHSLYRSATIYQSGGLSNDPRAITNQVLGKPGIEPCLPGWRPDSTGYYFIDRGAEFPRGPNPVRLLLTHPPFPLWLWLWRAFGIAVSVALVVAAWRLRR